MQIIMRVNPDKLPVRNRRRLRQPLLQTPPRLLRIRNPPPQNPLRNLPNPLHHLLLRSPFNPHRSIHVELSGRAELPPDPTLQPRRQHPPDTLFSQ
ncbi:hypothetical protein LINGRAPRIM_LOCUS1111 [Linum grandiflorum]